MRPLVQAIFDPRPRLQDLDAIADMYCRGDTVRSILLKKLNAAQTDDDNVFATVLPTATNYPAESVPFSPPHGPTSRDTVS